MSGKPKGNNGDYKRVIESCGNCSITIGLPTVARGKPEVKWL